MSSVLAVWSGKLTLLLLRSIGRRGNALPGLVVERLFPRYLPRVLARLPHGVVVVTGTNGKTTTTKMVATLLSQRLRVLTNDTGSNFTRGAITACVEHSSWSGALPYDVAVFELDEAWAVRFAEVVPPTRLLLLNVMRDQLDRFGEIDTTAALLGRVAAVTTTDVVLNRDDPRIAALATQTQATVSYYGVTAALRPEFPNDEELYGGDIYYSTLPASAELESLPTDGVISLRVGTDTRAVPLRAQGAHNAQNAAGAAALALTLGLSTDEIFAGLVQVEPAFGRGQSFHLDGRVVDLHLVKNPAGFRQSLRVLDAAGLQADGAGPKADGVRPQAVVIAINDDYADGRDMSWLWDVPFSPVFNGFPAGSLRLSTSGTRATDMAVRLHYDDIHTDAVTENLADAVRDAVAAVPVGARIVVFSTYTAMWALHAVLLKAATDVPADNEALS